MTEMEYQAELARLDQKIEQLSARMDQGIASLRKELKRQISVVHLAQIRDLTLSVLMPGTFKEHHKAYDEIMKVTNKFFKSLEQTPEDEMENCLLNLKKEINEITSIAGLGEIWEMPRN